MADTASNTPSVTQRQIADVLGVTQRTVASALGASGRVSQDTRRRVLETAAKLGYQPNRLAAGLRGGKTGSIGVIWPFVDPWAGDATIGLDVLERVQQRGLTTYQAQQSDDTAVLCGHLDDLLARRADAIVIHALPSQLADPAVQRRLQRAPAVVAVTREPVEGFCGDLVVHDRYRAIDEVVRHLARSGRRRPAMMTSMRHESNPPKYEAFLKSCRACGIHDHPHSLIDAKLPARPENHGHQHREALRQAFLDPSFDVDAIFCFNDAGALYVTRELHDRGLRVPEDIAVVGFNDSELGRIAQPPLATGDRKPQEVAAAVERLLAERLQAPEAPPQVHTIHMTFVHRASAG